MTKEIWSLLSKGLSVLPLKVYDNDLYGGEKNGVGDCSMPCSLPKESFGASRGCLPLHKVLLPLLSFFFLLQLVLTLQNALVATDWSQRNFKGLLLDITGQRDY